MAKKGNVVWNVNGVLDLSRDSLSIDDTMLQHYFARFMHDGLRMAITDKTLLTYIILRYGNALEPYVPRKTGLLSTSYYVANDGLRYDTTLASKNRREQYAETRYTVWAKHYTTPGTQAFWDARVSEGTPAFEDFIVSITPAVIDYLNGEAFYYFNTTHEGPGGGYRHYIHRETGHLLTQRALKNQRAVAMSRTLHTPGMRMAKLSQMSKDRQAITKSIDRNRRKKWSKEDRRRWKKQNRSDYEIYSFYYKTRKRPK